MMSSDAEAAGLEANKDICRRFLGHMAALEVDAALALLADDASWWVQGDWPGAGAHRGKQAIADLFGQLETLLAGPMDISLGAITAEADRVALEMRSRANLKDGREYRNSYHYLFTVRDGRITHGREYLDTDHLVKTLFATS